MESEAHTIRECGGKTEDGGGGGVPSLQPRTVPCVGEVAGDDPKYTWFRRNSGFQFPLGWMQILAWILIGGYIGYFSTCFVSVLPFWTRWICSTIWAVLATISVASHIFASATDVSDWRSRLDPNEIDHIHIPIEAANEMRYCLYCDRRVHIRSKHCRLCNRCVGHFDHHCQWLNLCVGANNYKSFFIFVVSTFLLSFMVLSGNIFIFVFYLTDTHPEFEHHVSSLLSLAPETHMILAGLFLLFALWAVYLLGDLIQLHVYLNCRGICTFDYILELRAAAESSVEGQKGGVEVQPEQTEGRICENHRPVELTRFDRHGHRSSVPDGHQIIRSEDLTRSVFSEIGDIKNSIHSARDSRLADLNDSRFFGGRKSSSTSGTPQDPLAQTEMNALELLSQAREKLPGHSAAPLPGMLASSPAPSHSGLSIPVFRGGAQEPTSLLTASGLASTLMFDGEIVGDSKKRSSHDSVDYGGSCSHSATSSREDSHIGGGPYDHRI